MNQRGMQLRKFGAVDVVINRDFRAATVTSLRYFARKQCEQLYPVSRGIKQQPGSKE